VSPGLVGRVVGEYRVAALIGTGGMSEVYEAVHPLMARPVALKVLRPHLRKNFEAARRFVDEARAVSRIRHRGVIDIFSCGTLEGGRPYLVMEHLSGHTLAHELKLRGRLLPFEAVGLTLELLDALEATHRAGLVHRDVKPANVFLAHDGRGRRHVKLLDFGIAKPVAPGHEISAQTQAGHVIGTPEYMAPEQARGEPVSAQTDLYALGCVLFELLTGHPPFPAGCAVEVMRHHVCAPVPRVRHVPVEIDALVTWMLAKSPQNRPPSAAGLSEHFERLLAELEPAAGVAAPPVPFPLHASRLSAARGTRSMRPVAPTVRLKAPAGWRRALPLLAGALVLALAAALGSLTVLMLGAPK